MYIFNNTVSGNPLDIGALGQVCYFQETVPCITKTNIRRLLMTVARWQYMDHTRFFLPGVRPFGVQTNPFNDNQLFIVFYFTSPCQAYTVLLSGSLDPRAHLFVCRYVIIMFTNRVGLHPYAPEFFQCCFGLL